MEPLVIQYPTETLIIWTLLNLLHYVLNFVNGQLYKRLVGNSKFEIKYNKKFFLKLLLWLGFGIGVLAAHRQAMLDKDITAYEYFVWVGAFFFLEIGYLLLDFLALLKYFVYQREMLKITYSFKTSTLMYSFEFFGYSVLVLLSFLVSKDSFLLGGSIGLAFGGILYILELTRKKNYSKIEHNK